MAGIVFRSAVDLAKAIASRDLSSVDVVRAHLDHIAAVNPAINAVVTLRADEALAEAEAADRCVAAGETLGPMHGVPCTLKDSIDTAGMVTTWGTMGRSNFVPDRDATVAARLRAAGAIILGKTNTPEFTLSLDGGTDNEIFGLARNPYDTSRSTSGSSGGAAAIVAAGGVPFDIGSDTGGSIREPAHVCGIAGLKPTSGRVSRAGHAMPPATGAIDGLTQLGPMARRVDDLFPLLSIITGPDGIDPACIPMPLHDPASINVANLRVAWYTAGGMTAPSDEIAAAVANAVAVLDDAGARTDESHPPGFERSAQLYLDLTAASGPSWILDYLAANDLPPLGKSLASRIAGEQASAAARRNLGETLRAIDRLRTNALAFMARFDAIVCPVATRTAWPLIGAADGDDDIAKWAHCMTYNLLGWPAATVPVGMSSEGLPIGVQVVAPAWREDVVLAVATAIQEAVPGCPTP